MVRYFSVTGHHTHGFRSVYLEALSEAEAMLKGKEMLKREYSGIRFCRFILRDES